MIHTCLQVLDYREKEIQADPQQLKSSYGTNPQEAGRNPQYRSVRKARCPHERKVALRESQSRHDVSRRLLKQRLRQRNRQFQRRSRAIFAATISAIPEVLCAGGLLDRRSVQSNLSLV
jgi:hypothetical protein